MFAEIRQKNLFVFIVMPTFFDLDKYAAIWRSRGLIHVYTDKGYGRGYFGYYNKDRKKTLYILGKKFYDYKKPKPNFRGRFTNYYVVDEEAYRKKKLEALKDHKSKTNLKEEERLPYILKVLCNHISMRQAEKELKEQGLVMSNDTIRLYIAKIPKETPLTKD